jgi:hypothetical protein
LMMREHGLRLKSRLVAPNDGVFLRAWLESELPSYAKCHLKSAFAGNESDAVGLCVAAPNGYRGWIALAAYYTGVPNPAYREIIGAVWNHDHAQLMGAAKHDRRMIRRMIKAAEFDHPFSGQLTIFRGASGVTAKRASKGLSWTLSRETACFFAYRFADPPKPIVLTTTVNAWDIILWDDSQNEKEVVLRRDISAELDPEPETWADAAKNVVERIKAREKARIEQYKLKLAEKGGSRLTA